MCRKFNICGGSLLASICAFFALLVWDATSGVASPDQTRNLLEKQFTTTVQPFMQTYCVSCHGKQSPQAQLNLVSYNSLNSVIRDYSHWALLLERLSAKEMPPVGIKKQPSAQQREAVMTWIRAVKRYEAQRNAGDPGIVLARRLSNAEYDYTIRDLTGVDMRPTREFPVDPANQEGFDNSGESLTISSGLMKKYVQAAKDIADKLVLTTTGLEFASHTVLAETDRDKFCILRIVDFYKRQPTDYADYFQAAWHYRHRAALGVPNATLQSLASEKRISPRYLEMVWKTLTDTTENAGPIAKLQALWNALPSPEKGKADGARAGCVAMRDWVVSLRKKLVFKFPNLGVPRGFSAGGQVFVLWKDREYASHRRLLNPATLQVGGVPSAREVSSPRGNRRIKVTPSADTDLAVPADEQERAPIVRGFSRFCNVFPDAFYIAERGRMYEEDLNDQGRFLTAGLHNSMGYFRDDTPLMELILSDQDRRVLDSMWDDFNTVAFVPERMHLEFFHYERAEAATILDPEFDFVRSEDKDATSDAKIKKLGDLYYAKANRNLKQSGGDPRSLQAIVDHFKWVSSTIRATERARLAAEPVHRSSLLQFASRAYRRPLTEAERTDLLAFYQRLKQKMGLTHEEAIRDTVVSILVSPKFLFRLDLEDATGGVRPASTPAFSISSQAVMAPPSTNGAQPLSDLALASRLSYFLWSSMPDAELLAQAKAGKLHQPEVLLAQTHRMVRDPRIRGLALELFGNWLDFRRFEEHNAVDRERFPAFNEALRSAMFEEPLHFLVEGFRQNGSALDLLYGKYTYVNGVLAQHYGMSDIKPEGNQWVKVENAERYGRGGLFPMAVFLTKNSAGLRTSPVKRGYWVVRRLLGEIIPPPPATVPQLPNDESKLGDLTLRQALEKHRSNPACSGCHARFDSYGLVFEGYGPIGELRNRDLGGKPVDAHAPFPGGVECTGVTGLQDFVRKKRQQDFLDNFSRKLLSYALGRSLQISDDSTLQEMQKRLSSGGYRFGTLIDTVVTSRQFRYRRASVTLARN